MSDISVKMTEELLSRYDKIMSDKGINPEWAVHKRNSPDELVKCTVPFVGKNFAEQTKRILVYASAENLAEYYPGNDKHWQGDWLDDDAQAKNRHRRCFDDPAFQDGTFFPYVHISPMNNGCLATAAFYIASKLYNITAASPREFYESIAFGNYGKYSVETEFQRYKRTGIENNKEKSNTDYAGNKELLDESHAFIKEDIEQLKPDCIIMPKTMYEVDMDFINGIKGDAVIIPIYQINARVINLYISTKYNPCDVTALPENVKIWYDELHKDGMTG